MSAKHPQRIISTAVLARRLNISRPALAKHVRRGLFAPDFQSDRGSYFLPERLPQLREVIADNRRRNWRHLTAFLT
jgi:hypothetical protein